LEVLDQNAEKWKLCDQVTCLRVFFSIYCIWEEKENSASHKKIEGLAYLEAKRIEFFEWKLKNP
jgi:hypothetical protein